MTTTTETTSSTTATKSVVSPASTPVTTNAALSKDWTWITQHIILLLLLAALTFGGVYYVEKVVADRDAALASRYQTLLTQQANQTKQLVSQYQASESAREALDTKLLAQNSQLSQAIEQRNQQIAQLVKTDATLSAEAAASKISTQIDASPQEVVANGNDVDLDLPSARRVAVGLDKLSAAQQNLSDVQTQLSNETKVAISAQTDLTSANKVIDSQKAQLTDSTKACNAQIAAVKAKARKSMWKHLLEGGIIVEAIRVYFTHSI